MTHRHVVFGFFDIVFSITTLFIVYNYFFQKSKVYLLQEKSSRIRDLLKVIIVSFFSGFSTRDTTNLLSFPFN